MIPLLQPVWNMRRGLTHDRSRWINCVDPARYCDLDFANRIVFAKGTKTDYRTRYVGVTEEWALQIGQLGHAPQSTLIYTTYGVYIGEAKLGAKAKARCEEAAIAAVIDRVIADSTHYSTDHVSP